MSKVTREQINTALKAVSQATYDEFGSYSYACGYYEALLVQLIASQPVASQLDIMDALARTTEKYTGETV
jgi:hypothetical protein